MKTFLTILALVLLTWVASAQSLTVDLAPQDTALNLDAINYSTSAALSPYTWPTGKIANVVLMKFALTAIPLGATVTTATLTATLTGADAFVDGTYAVTLHKLTKNPAIPLATGVTADGVTPWTPNTTCCGGAGFPLAQSDISPARATSAIDRVLGPKTWDATAIVQEWLDTPSTNFGLLLNADPTKAGDAFRTFASSEAATVASRPLLRVVYQTGPPSAPQSDLLPTSQLVWDEGAATLLDAQGYSYAVYVDGVKNVLPITTCVQAVTAGQFTCQGTVPASAVLVGTHVLEATATSGGSETPRSNPVTVVQLPLVLIVTTTNLALTGTPTTATFTATVSSASGMIPTGTVVFKDNGVITRTTTVNAAGNATWGPVTTLRLGTHNITAEYAGSATMAAGVSAVLATTVVIQAPSGLRVLR